VRSVLHRLALIVALACGGLLAAVPLDPGSIAQAQQTGNVPRDGGARDSGRNPTADSVNEDLLFRQGNKIRGIISIPDSKEATLVQPQGREWRNFREVYLPWIGGIAIIGMLLALAAFYMKVGTIGGHDQISGKKILRFTWLERFAHWMTATCFIVLAISGLNYVFGKRLLMPLIGPDAFSTWSQWAKYAHNYLAWPFMLGILIMFVVWVRDNVPNRVDWQWLKAGGGFVGGRHVHAGRFNAGQKGVFWIVVIGGALMSLTGIALEFPFSLPYRYVDINGMQLAQGAHALIGMGFIAVIIAHIYIGTLGMSGAYDAMGTGEVDIAWAKAHHDLWVEQEQAKNARGPQLRPSSVPAE
jgi:formate dehydrogenase subunit gamma